MVRICKHILGDVVTYCDLCDTCKDCPRYGKDCDGEWDETISEAVPKGNART